MDITKTDEKTADKAVEKTADTAEAKATAPEVAAETAAEGTPEAAAEADGAADRLVEQAAEQGADDELDDEDLDDELLAAAPAGSGAGVGGAAVVSAALGAVALTGTWTGKIVSERETLVGQISTSQSGTPAQQISEIYGDAWHATALVNGVFALLALVTAVLVLVLVRPERPAWIRAVALAGAVLGGLGLLLSVGTYFDLFLSLPSAGS
ncbi:hypothetical protein [Streptomyces sp. WAC01280]|uniref:hypothetical protein n=1 Tax=Streptomyces sp. WAC01280 TaxID=2487424 RepID=UPI000F798D9D|nr:hypothetical protein [Streptomyces sp. WAC01280]RSS55706.1 hypothetical protein EF909_21495 [Streptomyces sp. WAC01280]